MGDFCRLHGCHRSDSLSKQVEPPRPGIWSFVLSCLRCPLRMVGDLAPAQPRIISQANNRTVEPRSHVGYQVLRFTTSAWRGRIFVWLRGKNQEFIAIAGENIALSPTTLL